MKTLKIVGITILVTIISLEGILRWVDPLGLSAVMDNLSRLQRMTTRLEDTYVLKPGTYQLAGWSATIDQDGHRVVPDTNPDASCTLVLLGDSVTMGWGVNDAQTWVNLIARQLPNVRLINTGVFGYNVQDVWEVYQRESEADGYLYLVIENDDEPRAEYFGVSQTYPLATLNYLKLWNTKPTSLYKNRVMFQKYLGLLQSVSNLQIAGFNSDPLAKDLPVNHVAAYTHRISRADAHANAEGNIEIYHELLPVLMQMREVYCKAKS